MEVIHLDASPLQLSVQIRNLLILLSELVSQVFQTLISIRNLFLQWNLEFAVESSYLWGFLLVYFELGLQVRNLLLRLSLVRAQQVLLRSGIQKVFSRRNWLSSDSVLVLLHFRESLVESRDGLSVPQNQLFVTFQILGWNKQVFALLLILSEKIVILGSQSLGFIAEAFLIPVLSLIQDSLQGFVIRLREILSCLDLIINMLKLGLQQFNFSGQALAPHGEIPQGVFLLSIEFASCHHIFNMGALEIPVNLL